MEIPKGREVTQIFNSHGKIFFNQDFEYPDGKIHEFSLMKSAKGPPAIIFPIAKNGNVIAVNQFRHGANRQILEFPGGNAVGEENIEEVVKNELLEETGFQSERVILLGNKSGNGYWFEPNFMRVTYFPFLALDCSFVKSPKLDETEIMETKQFSITRWLNMIASGKITDSKTIAVTFLALLILGVDLNLNEITIFKKRFF